MNKTKFSEEELNGHIKHIFDCLNEIRNELSDSSYKFPLLLEVSFDNTRKSNVAKVRDFFNFRNKINALANLGNSLIVKIDSIDDLNKHIQNCDINKDISQAKKNSLVKIKDICVFKPKVESGLTSSDVLKVKLVEFLEKDLNDMTRNQFLDVCKSNNVDADEYFESLHLFSLKNVTESALKKISNLRGVLSIERMPIVVLE